MRRRTDESPVSLFSFQDIITSVTGVLILLSLILSLSVLGTPSEPAPPAERPTADVSDEQLADLRAQVRQLAEDTERVTLVRQRTKGRTQEELERELAELRRQRSQLQEAQRSLAESLLQTSDAQLALLEQSLQAAQTEQAQLQAELSAQEGQRTLLNNGRAVVYNLAPGLPKRAWFVDVSAARITVTSGDAATAPREFAGSGARAAELAFLAWAQGRPADAEYFVLLVRPDGIKTFDALYGFLRARKFDTGLDLLSRDAVVITQGPEQ